MNNLDQKIAIKSLSEEISILGAEAFMLPADMTKLHLVIM